MTDIGPVWKALSPWLVMVVGALLFMIWGAVERRTGRLCRSLAVAGMALATAAAVRLWGDAPLWLFGGSVVIDRLTLFVTVLVSVSGAASILLSEHYAERFGIDRAEFFSLVYFATAGMVVLAASANLVTLFIGLELMSLPVYVLAGFRRRDIRSNEAALKYFVLGAFASALMLYGIALVYGAAGATQYSALLKTAKAGGGLLTSLAMGLILAGFAFKVSAVPFHMWVPDVYEGAPTPVTAFMASAVKVAAFGAFLRLIASGFLPIRAEWEGILWWLAVLTMTYGNAVALVQRNVKRMLAYSSIAHAGYAMVALVAFDGSNDWAGSALLYYVLVYTFMTLGAFAFVAALEKRGFTRGLEIDDYAGMMRTHPWLAVCMSIFLFSLAGIPPFAGFFAKYYAFSAALRSGAKGLVILAVLNSVLSLYYYLRVIVVMTMRESDVPVTVHADAGVKVVLWASLLAVLWLGVGPSTGVPGVEQVLRWSRDSVAALGTFLHGSGLGF
jgi:NADH-quinone oxidoreductase subunit N